MTLEEALKLADEAEREGYLNKFPQALIVLAKKIRADHKVTCCKLDEKK